MHLLNSIPNFQKEDIVVSENTIDTSLAARVEIVRRLTEALMEEIDALPNGAHSANDADGGSARGTRGTHGIRQIDFYAEVERFERNLIERALARTSGNQTQAARLLKLKLTTLNSKIKLYGITPRQLVDEATFGAKAQKTRRH
ncbi:MAG: helix-turn-helix domain-containing protein [Pyrinomonadaceae bacterium]